MNKQAQYIEKITKVSSPKTMQKIFSILWKIKEIKIKQSIVFIDYIEKINKTDNTSIYKSVDDGNSYACKNVQ